MDNAIYNDCSLEYTREVINEEISITYLISGLILYDAFKITPITLNNSLLYKRIEFHKHDYESNSSSLKRPFEIKIYLKNQQTPFSDENIKKYDDIIRSIILNILWTYQNICISDIDFYWIEKSDTNSTLYKTFSNKDRIEIGFSTRGNYNLNEKLLIGNKLSEDILNFFEVLKINEEIPQYVFLYQILYEKSGGSDSKVTRFLKDKGYSNTYNLVTKQWKHTNNGTTKNENELVYYRNCASHSLDIKNINDYKQLVSTIRVKIRILIKILIDVLS